MSDLEAFARLFVVLAIVGGLMWGALVFVIEQVLALWGRR